MTKQIITTDQLFSEIISNLKVARMLPSIEHAIPGISHGIYDIEFDVYGILTYGSNEGIYLEMIIDGSFDREFKTGKQRIPIGTIKTLDSSDASMKEMALLMANFILEARRYVDTHEDELIRRGYLCKKPDANCGIYVSSKESAMAKSKEGYSVKDLYSGNILDVNTD